MPIQHTPVVAATAEPCQLAENPFWDDKSECVYWTDIPAGKIFRRNHSTRKSLLIYDDEPVGGFTMQENGDLLLFRTSDIVLLNAEGEITKIRNFSDTGMLRFNDVIADPCGRVFAGTVGENRLGGLYRLDLDGSITKLFTGTNCSNGMGFSPDLKRFYWTCSTTRHIFQFDFDVDSGSLSNRRVFYAATEDEGIPDGLTIDAEGCVWSARWGGASIIRHAPDGRAVGKISFPAENITSLCFAGKNLDELFVTSAESASNASSPKFSLFHTQVGQIGMKEFRSRSSVAQ